MRILVGCLVVTALLVPVSLVRADLVIGASPASGTIPSGGSTTLTVSANGSGDSRTVGSYNIILALVPQGAVSGNLTFQSYSNLASFTSFDGVDGDPFTLNLSESLGGSAVGFSGTDFSSPFVSASSLVGAAGNLANFSIVASAGAVGTWNVYAVNSLNYTDDAGQNTSRFTQTGGPPQISFDNTFSVALSSPFSSPSMGSLLTSITAVPEPSSFLAVGLVLSLGGAGWFVRRRRAAAEVA